MTKEEQAQEILSEVVTRYSREREDDPVCRLILDREGKICWGNRAFWEICPCPKRLEAELRPKLVAKPRSKLEAKLRSLEKDTRKLLEQFLKEESLSISPVQSLKESREGYLMLLRTAQEEPCGAVLSFPDPDIQSVPLAEEYSRGGGFSAYIRRLTGEQKNEGKKMQKLIDEMKELYPDAGEQLGEIEKQMRQMLLKSLLIERSSNDMGRKIQAENDISVGASLVTADAAKRLEETCKKIEKSAANVGSRFDYRLPESRYVRCAFRLLDEAVTELACNALQYAGGSDILLEAEYRDGFIQVTVTDKGPGISPERMEKVFFPSYSYDPSRGMGCTGGLGLSSFSKQVRLAEGELWLWSDGISGTSAQVKLPYRSLDVQLEESRISFGQSQDQGPDMPWVLDQEKLDQAYVLRMAPVDGLPEDFFNN